MEQQQQQQQTEEKRDLMAEFRSQKEAEQKQKQHQMFLSNMENKSHTDLKMAELSYLYNNHRLVYENLITNNEYVVKDLELADRLNRNRKSAEEIKAEAKASVEAENPKSETDKQLEKLINEAITKSLERHKLF